MTSSSAVWSPKERIILSKEVYIVISEQIYDKKPGFIGWLCPDFNV